MISRSPDAAVYMQLAAILRGRIESGQYQPGLRIPSEPHLAEEFGVARETVRRAVRELRTDGLVDVRPGSGTWVAIASEVTTVRLPRGASVEFRALLSGETRYP